MNLAIDGVAAVPYVYGDVFWLVNGVVDLILLYVAGRLAGCGVRPARLFLGAALGATYALGFLYPSLAPLYHPVLKVTALVGILLVGCPPPSGRAFLRLVFWFLAAASLVAGAASALARLWVTNPWVEGAGRSGVPAWALLLGLLLSVAAGRLAWFSLRHRWARESCHLPVEIALAGRQVACTGLLDTGNHLEDPLTGAPVLVVELSAVAPLLPPGVSDACRREGGLLSEAAADLLGERTCQARFRLLPFSTLGQSHGLFLGFRPDRVTVSEGGRRWEASQVTVAVTPQRLSPAGEYQALIHPLLLGPEGEGRPGSGAVPKGGRVALCRH